MNKDIGFKTKPELETAYIDSKGIHFYILKTDLVFFNGEDNITVRTIYGNDTFYTNLASTPKFLHWLIPPDKSLYKYPSILHDYLYSERTVSRRFADKMFLLAIKSEMRDKLRATSNERTRVVDRIRYTFIAYSFWAMVRIFGKGFRV